MHATPWGVAHTDTKSFQDHMEIHMRHIQTRRPLPKKREGFTLIELLVVISIIATLVALITPAVQSAREAARRTQCINNMKNITLAVKNFASQNDGKFPTYYDSYTGTNADWNYGWPVALLPFLDAAAIYDRISSQGTLPSAAGNQQAAPMAVNAEYKPGLFLQVFVCPDDLDKDGAPGGLSYAAKIGYIGGGLWGNADVGNDPYTGGTTTNVHHQVAWDVDNGAATTNNVNQTRDTGVFMDERVRPVTEDGVSRADGMSQTLMFAENLQANNWASWKAGEVGFGANNADLAFETLVTMVPSTVAPDDNDLTLRLSATPTNGSRINKNVQANVGTQWRPSSGHPGIVIVSFCDGRARALNDGIDSGVYHRLITSGGTKKHYQRLVGDDF